MPYRFLLYLASEYSKLNTDDLLYSNKLQMLDTPHFVVFYNGTDPLPEYSTLKLSSAYRNKEEAPQLELQVQVININLGFNAELMDACQILKEYAQFVAEVRKQAKVYPNRQAIVQAVDVCIKKDILKEFLLENKKEVIDMVFSNMTLRRKRGSFIRMDEQRKLFVYVKNFMYQRKIPSGS